MDRIYIKLYQDDNYGLTEEQTIAANCMNSLDDLFVSCSVKLAVVPPIDVNVKVTLIVTTTGNEYKQIMTFKMCLKWFLPSINFISSITNKKIQKIKVDIPYVPLEIQRNTNEKFCLRDIVIPCYGTFL